MIKQTIKQYIKNNDIKNLSYWDRRNLKRKLGYSTMSNKKYSVGQDRGMCKGQGTDNTDNTNKEVLLSSDVVNECNRITQGLNDMGYNIVINNLGVLI